MLISAHCLPFSISSTPSPVSFPLLMLYIFLPGNSIVALGRHFSLPVRCSFGLLRYCNSTGLGVGWICSRKTRQSKRGHSFIKIPEHLETRSAGSHNKTKLWLCPVSIIIWSRMLEDDGGTCQQTLSSFHNRCLRKIRTILSRPTKIPSEQLHERRGTSDMKTILNGWRWTGREEACRQHRRGIIETNTQWKKETRASKEYLEKNRRDWNQKDEDDLGWSGENTQDRESG